MGAGKKADWRQIDLEFDRFRSQLSETGRKIRNFSKIDCEIAGIDKTAAVQ